MAELLLHDYRVLVVEDEYLIAESLQRDLQQAGATVVGPVPNVAGALALLQSEQDIDAAVLDINLGQQKVYDVVDALRARGIRCVFATGNDGADVPSAYSAVARCEKPINSASLVQALLGNNEATVSDHVRGTPQAIRKEVLALIELADSKGYTLVAARLCEALDAIDGCDPALNS